MAGGESIEWVDADEAMRMVQDAGIRVGTTGSFGKWRLRYGVKVVPMISKAAMEEAIREAVNRAKAPNAPG